jgi:hypothetical protein
MKCPQKIDYEQSSILIEIAHSLFLYRFLMHCKTASSSCKKQCEIGYKFVDFLINSYYFGETVRKK